jgi:polysaccharide export outer membrane protein
MNFSPSSGDTMEAFDRIDANGYHYMLRPLTVAEVQAAKPMPVRITAAQPYTPTRASLVPYEYRVGPGDVLRIVVWDHPELNNPGIGNLPSSSQQAGSLQILSAQAAATAGVTDPLGRVVQPDGTIYYPYVGTLHVAGKTLPAIRRELAAGVGRYIRSPQLDVTIAGFRSKRIYVTGEVRQPGVLALTDVPMAVSDAVSLSGGLTANADLAAATVTRRDTQIAVDLYRLLYLGDLSGNIRLVDGDIVNVPNRRINKVFLMGEVARPQAIVMPADGPYTLAEALNDAGGMSAVTSDADVFMVFHLDARSPVAIALADQVRLSPRDIVYVDAASVTRFNRVVSQLLPFAGGLTDVGTLTK